MESISDAGLTKSVRLRFGVRGSTELGLDSNISPTWDLSDPEPPYHNRSGGSIFLSQALVAGESAYVGLNAPTSLPANFRGVFEAIQPMSAASSVIGIVDSTAASFTALGLVEAPVQSSWDGLARPALRSLLGTNAVALGINAWQFNATAGGQGPANMKFVLSPGMAFLCRGGPGVATAMCFRWSEYYVA